MRRHLIASAVVALALILSGCAKSDQAPTMPADSNQNGATDEQGAAGESGVILGQVTLGEQAYELTEVILCERFENETVQFDLEVIAMGRADDGAFLQLDVYQEPGSNGFDWNGPEGLYSSDETATVTVSGDRVIGSGVVLGVETGSRSLEMSFDLALPTDSTECR